MITNLVIKFILRHDIWEAQGIYDDLRDIVRLPGIYLSK